ncbi:MAG: hypothetical protein IID45_12455, partial [Planctomycetes bacterium]|nr:hypothetical protein [Planctomycetota bacterium]
MKLANDRRNGWRIFCGAVVLCFICAFQPLSAAPQQRAISPRERAKIEFYKSKVKPILKAHCYKCHGNLSKPKGGLSLASREGMLKGGETGPAVSLKEPGKSLLIQVINYKIYEMPPSKKLPQAKIDILTKWVKMGAPVSQADLKSKTAHAKKQAPAVTAEAKRFWSFRPVKRPAVPAVRNQKWVTNEIDRFLLARLERA